MVFQEIICYNCNLLCWASGITLDLVAATNYFGMENRTYNRNIYSQLDIVRDYDGINSYHQGVLQSNQWIVKSSRQTLIQQEKWSMSILPEQSKGDWGVTDRQLTEEELELVRKPVM